MLAPALSSLCPQSRISSLNPSRTARLTRTPGRDPCPGWRHPYCPRPVTSTRSRTRWPGVQSVRSFAPVCARTASRSSGGSRREPGHGKQNCAASRESAHRRDRLGAGCAARGSGGPSSVPPASGRRSPRGCRRHEEGTPEPPARHATTEPSAPPSCRRPTGVPALAEPRPPSAEPGSRLDDSRSSCRSRRAPPPAPDAAPSASTGPRTRPRRRDSSSVRKRARVSALSFGMNRHGLPPSRRGPQASARVHRFRPSSMSRLAG